MTTLKIPNSKVSNATLANGAASGQTNSSKPVGSTLSANPGNNTGALANTAENQTHSEVKKTPTGNTPSQAKPTKTDNPVHIFDLANCLPGNTNNPTPSHQNSHFGFPSSPIQQLFSGSSGTGDILSQVFSGFKTALGAKNGADCSIPSIPGKQNVNSDEIDPSLFKNIQAKDIPGLTGKKNSLPRIDPAGKTPMGKPSDFGLDKGWTTSQKNTLEVLLRKNPGSSSDYIKKIMVKVINSNQEGLLSKLPLDQLAKKFGVDVND